MRRSTTVSFILLAILICSVSAVASEYKITAVTDDEIDQSYPYISGGKIVWADKRNGNWGVYGYTISTGEQFVVIDDVGYADGTCYTAIDADMVLWTDRRNVTGSGVFDLYGRILGSENLYPIREGGNWLRWPVIAGDTVSWQEQSYYNRVYWTDLEDLIARAAVSYTLYPDTDGEILVYVQGLPYQIWATDIETEQSFPVSDTAESGQWFPAVHGNIVVWQDDRNGNWDIYGADITVPAAPVVFQITDDPYDQVGPEIWGNTVVWQDERNGNTDIYGADISDLSNITEFQVTSDPTDDGRPGYWIGPEIEGDIIVYRSYRGFDWDICYASLETTINVAIGVNPGDLSGKINLNSRGMLQVVIYSTADFDTASIDPATIRLAGAAVAMRGKSGNYMAVVDDFNLDGLFDLKLQMRIPDLNVEELQDGIAVLTGQTFAGDEIEGVDEITLVKRREPGRRNGRRAK